MNTPVVKKDKTFPNLKFLMLFNHHGVLGVLIAILTFCIIFSLMLTAVAPKRYELSAGDIATESIPATRDVEDKAATRDRVEAAREKVPDFYTLDQTITSGIIGDVQVIFSGIDAVRSLAIERLREWEEEQAEVAEKARQEAALTQETQAEEEEREEGQEEQEEQEEEIPLTPAEKEEPVSEPLPVEILQPTPELLYHKEFMDKARELLIVEISNEDLLTAILAEQRDINQLKLRLVTLLTDMLEVGIKREQLTEFKTTLREEIQGLPVSGEVKLLGVNVGVQQLQANMLFDPEKTIEEKQKVASRVEKVFFKKGQFIAQAGQPVTSAQIELLRELGLLKDDTIDFPFYIGIALMILLIQGAVILYLAYFERDLIHQPLMLLMMSLVFCLVLGLGYVISYLHLYAIPAAMGGMLFTVLLKPRIGMVMNMALAAFFGFMLGSHFGVVVMVLAGGMMGICLLNNMQQRNTLIWAGMGVSGFNILAVAGFEMMVTGGWLSSAYTSLWGVVGGMFSAVLTIGMLPIFENLFNVSTTLKLVELANPNQPILKRLLMETPGTYHHSIIVANLAESAADAIGANGLLARVGAYYHDIGKLQRPYYFKENQFSENPHDRLDPVLSTRIITAHTLDGVELAKRYKVPKILQDFILQHHGTTPVVYFYHKAKNLPDNKNDVILDSFRYIGPRPISRETAIVMMADTVEAAVRSMPEATSDKVEGLIRRLIKEKLDDKQFDASPLTLGDLEKIAMAFANAIGGIFHERVKYPEVNLKEEKEKDDAAH